MRMRAILTVLCLLLGTWAVGDGAQADLIGYWTFDDDGDVLGAGGIDDRANVTDEHDATLASGAFDTDVPTQLMGTTARSLNLTGGSDYAIVDTFTGTAADADFNTGGAVRREAGRKRPGLAVTPPQQLRQPGLDPPGNQRQR